MTSIVRMVAVCILSCVSQQCLSYETETHALITRTAFERSDLVVSGSIAERLGLDRMFPPRPFSPYWTDDAELSFYYMDGGGTPEAFGNTNVFLVPQGFERCQMQEFVRRFQSPDPRWLLFSNTVELSGAPTLPIQNWLVRGAIREDDLGPMIPFAASSANCGAYMLLTGQDGNVRVFNHFFDPAWDIPMTPCAPLATCQRAPDWGVRDCRCVRVNAD